MRIAVVGAAGRTGRQVVEQALGREMEVIAVARKPEGVARRHENLVLRAADVRDAEAVLAALEGAQSVVSALGTGSSRAATDIYSRGVSNEIEAMRAHGIDRLAVISAAPAGPRAEQPFLERRLAMPMLERLFGHLYADMREMEAVLRRCEDLRWVALRPPRLVDKPARGGYRTDAKPLPKARTLTYSDLAKALLDCVDDADRNRGSVYVAN